MIKGIETVSVEIHDGAVRKLDKVRYIPSFKRNLIFLSRLDSSSYRWRADGGILKVMHSNRIVMKGKQYGEHYLLVGRLMRDGAPKADKSNMRQET